MPPTRSDLTILLGPRLPGVKWMLALEGQEEDLQALAKMFGSPGAPGVRVWVDKSFAEPVYFLHAPEFEAMTRARDVFFRAQLLVRRINGLCILKFDAFGPVEAGVVYSSAGAHSVGVSSLYRPTDPLLAYLDYKTGGKWGVMNVDAGPIVAGLPPTEDWLGAADRCTPDVDAALDLLTVATVSDDWPVLFVIWEIIEAHVGQPSKIEKLKWASRDEITLFKKTASSYTALGTKARHGPRPKPVPPLPRPMTFKEARALIQRLLLKWVQSEAERVGP